MVYEFLFQNLKEILKNRFRTKTQNGHLGW